MEYASYLAGERHSDRPACVSPVLLNFMIAFNDGLDDETRQKLRPYIVRTLGTAGDGQDVKRSYMALDWLIRTHTPAFLDAAGLHEEANKLRGLAAIDGIEQAQATGPEVHAAGAAARDAASDAAWEAASDAARDAAWAAAWTAAWEAASDAARDAAWVAAWDAAWEAAWVAAWDAAWVALRPTLVVVRESAFELLDRMIDPGGIHDVLTEEQWLETTVR